MCILYTSVAKTSSGSLGGGVGITAGRTGTGFGTGSEPPDRKQGKT